MIGFSANYISVVVFECYRVVDIRNIVGCGIFSISGASYHCLIPTCKAICTNNVSRSRGICRCCYGISIMKSYSTENIAVIVLEYNGVFDIGRRIGCGVDCITGTSHHLIVPTCKSIGIGVIRCSRRIGRRCYFITVVIYSTANGITVVIFELNSIFDINWCEACGIGLVSTNNRYLLIPTCKHIGVGVICRLGGISRCGDCRARVIGAGANDFTVIRYEGDLVLIYETFKNFVIDTVLIKELDHIIIQATINSYKVRTVECQGINVGKRCVNIQTFEVYTTIEQFVAKLDNLLSELNGFKSVTIVERTSSDRIDIIAEHKLRDSSARTERISSDRSYRIGNVKFCKSLTVIERCFTDGLALIGKCNALCGNTSVESIIFDGNYGVRNFDTTERCTTIECVRQNLFNSIRDIDRFHAVAIVECIRADIIYSNRESHCFQRFTAIKSVFSNAYNCSVDNEVCHRVTIVE